MYILLSDSAGSPFEPVFVWLMAWTFVLLPVGLLAVSKTPFHVRLSSLFDGKTRPMCAIAVAVM
jgi:hypothetical protein